MTKIYYAIVRSNALKYKKRWMFPIINAQLPIFWNRKVALKTAETYGKSVEVIKIELFTPEDMMQKLFI